MGVFTGGEVWTGGFYELALEYEHGVARGLTDDLHELWHLDVVDGCYLDSEREPTDQLRHEFESSLLSAGQLLGVATCPGRGRVACGSCTVQETDGSDWLVFYLPMSALAHVCPVGGFPLDWPIMKLGAFHSTTGWSMSHETFSREHPSRLALLV